MWSSNSTSGRSPKRSEFIHNSQKVGTTQVSTDRRMGKQNVVCTYSEALFSLTRKEILTQATTWINFEDIMFSAWGQSQKGEYRVMLLRQSGS